MRKIKLYIATSLNGKIAKPDGSVDWLEAIPKPDNSDYGYSEFYDTVDTTLQGHNTYKKIQSWGIQFPYKGKKNYVLTTDTTLKRNDDVEFISDDHVNFVKGLKEENGGDIWLIGGGKTNAKTRTHPWRQRTVRPQHGRGVRRGWLAGPPFRPQDR